MQISNLSVMAGFTELLCFLAFQRYNKQYFQVSKSKFTALNHHGYHFATDCARPWKNSSKSTLTQKPEFPLSQEESRETLLKV
jgi:hypothetical protein